MKRVEEKLARWRRLYEELRSAEILLESEFGPSAADLQDEVKRLKRESDEAMDEVHAALANKRQASPVGTGSAHH